MKELIIIGAGLGAESITLQGINEMQRADVVLYDRLVDEKILSHAPECELIQVGKMPYSKHCILQKDINDLIIKHLSKNRCVVRLKGGGDSTVFARSMEELEAAKSLGAETKIIPGITSAATLSAKVQTALTDRRRASGVVFITGHPHDGNVEKAYNWQALASLELTIVIYMGVKNAQFIAETLIGYGTSGNTPVVIGEKMESPDEKLVKCSLCDLADTINDKNITNPATIIIGEIFL